MAFLPELVEMYHPFLPKQLVQGIFYVREI